MGPGIDMTIKLQQYRALLASTQPRATVNPIIEMTITTVMVRILVEGMRLQAFRQVPPVAQRVQRVLIGCGLRFHVIRRRDCMLLHNQTMGFGVRER